MFCKYLFIILSYGLGSLAYWYIEKRMTKNIFYIGYNENYVNKLHNNARAINNIAISSEVKEYTAEYRLTFSFHMKGENKGQLEAETVVLNASDLFNERGYLIKEELIKQFETALRNQLRSSFP